MCISGRSVRTRRERILWGFLCLVLGQTNSGKTFTLCVYCMRERERERCRMRERGEREEKDRNRDEDQVQSQ